MTGEQKSLEMMRSQQVITCSLLQILAARARIVGSQRRSYFIETNV